MFVIGITGGTGSGKSTVASILSRYGGEIIDADLIAREVVAKGSKALDELVESFGKEILDEEGNLDRKELAAMVFADKDKLELLNNITHKYIIQRIIEKLENIKSEGKARFAVIDAPIPVEHGFLDVVDVVWVVVADEGQRIRRIMERSGLSRQEAINRIKSQKSQEDYIKIADKVIHNNGCLKQLEKETIYLLGETEREFKNNVQ